MEFSECFRKVIKGMPVIISQCEIGEGGRRVESPVEEVGKVEEGDGWGEIVDWLVERHPKL